MIEWKNRQLRTSKLLRLCAEYLLKQNISSSNIYGLCMLTWITSSYDSKNGSYIRSTKLPALSNIFNEDFLKYPYDKIGARISVLTGKNLKEVEELIYEGTGYTNFYKAYRLSSKDWLLQNIDKIIPLIHVGIDIKNDKEAEAIAKGISLLPKIPKGNNSRGKMSPECILTPLFFSLDKRLRFPLINRNKGVTKILKRLKVYNEDLIIQFNAVVKLIGTGDIQTSIDIDCLAGDLPDFISIDGKLPKRKRLTKKNDKDLSLKDENDVLIINKSLTINAKRLHNKLTNLILDKLSIYELHEGNSDENKFDVLVKNINSDLEDILIEVKSSSDIANVRMAVGQLLDYYRQLYNNKKTHIAVFLPEKPDKNVIDFLDFCKISIIWIEENEIYGNCEMFPFKFKEI